MYYKLNQLGKSQDLIYALSEPTRVPPGTIRFTSPSRRDKGRCAARMQWPYIDMPQQNPNPGQAKSWRPCLQISLGIKRYVPAIQHWGSGGEAELSKIRKEDTATISHDCQSRSLKLNVSIDRIRMLSSQPFYCFTKTQCLNSHVIWGHRVFVHRNTR